MDADIFVSGKKKLRIQKYPDTCGRGLIVPHLFPKFIYEVRKFEVWKFRSVTHDYRVVLKKIRAGCMPIEESKCKCENSKLPFLINDNISVTKLTSLLLHQEI